jgi:mannose/fructose-specific phosphotransferase system component IIA
VWCLNSEVERNWRDAVDYLMAYLYYPGEHVNRAAVQAMEDKPKAEILEGLSGLSMRLLLELVSARGGGVVDDYERIRQARRTLDDLRGSPPKSEQRT